MERPQAILFDVDGLLITTGGAGASSWRWAFDELYGIPADIGKFTEAGMTDPVVGRLTFTSVIGREPSPTELAKVMSHYLMRLPEEVSRSSGYRVLAGVEDLLPRLCKAGFLLGITTGAAEAAAHIKLARANLNRFFSFGGHGSDSADRGELTRKAIHRAGEILGSALDSRRVLVVGDTPNDIAAAHARVRSASASPVATRARRNCMAPAPTTCSGLCSKSYRASPSRYSENPRAPEATSSRIIQTLWPCVCRSRGAELSSRCSARRSRSLRSPRRLPTLSASPQPCPVGRRRATCTG
jgi:phosphoglycolate phosphatase